MDIKTNNKKIRIEVNLRVTPQKAWNLLTEDTHITYWWGSHVELEAKPGGAFREVWFDNERRVVTSGNITIFNPPSKLKMTWADEDWPGDTIVSFSLSEDDSGTQLIFEHSGWEIHPNDKRENLIEAHKEGWSHYLHQFAAYTLKF